MQKINFNELPAAVAGLHERLERIEQLLQPHTATPRAAAPTSVAIAGSQKQTILRYLREHTVTASMLSAATGIPQKNICRAKRALEKAGQLWEVEKKPCLLTRRAAFYLTTNPDQAPAPGAARPDKQDSASPAASLGGEE